MFFEFYVFPRLAARLIPVAKWFFVCSWLLWRHATLHSWKFRWHATSYIPTLPTTHLTVFLATRLIPVANPTFWRPVFYQSRREGGSVVIPAQFSPFFFLMGSGAKFHRYHDSSSGTLVITQYLDSFSGTICLSGIPEPTYHLFCIPLFLKSLQSNPLC